MKRSVEGAIGRGDRDDAAMIGGVVGGLGFGSYAIAAVPRGLPDAQAIGGGRFSMDDAILRMARFCRGGGWKRDERKHHPKGGFPFKVGSFRFRLV